MTDIIPAASQLHNYVIEENMKYLEGEDSSEFFQKLATACSFLCDWISKIDQDSPYKMFAHPRMSRKSFEKLLAILRKDLTKFNIIEKQKEEK